MKKIAIYCVNYCSYGALHNYYKSIVMAARQASACCFIDLYIADNTEKSWEPIDLPCAENVHSKVFDFHKNLGYFGAIHQLMKQTDYTVYDYIIISNVDVKVDSYSFLKLCKIKTTEEVGWIAPQIYSETLKRNLNPALHHRYSAKKLRIIQLQFKFPILHSIYYKMVYKHKQANIPITRNGIYAGHGSFIILTKNYFNKCGKINYPVFLYDEELYLAEECRLNGLTVVYEPDIKVFDTGKVSTGKMTNKFYCKCNLEGLRFILNKYYKE